MYLMLVKTSSLRSLEVNMTSFMAACLLAATLNTTPMVPTTEDVLQYRLVYWCEEGYDVIQKSYIHDGEEYIPYLDSKEESI
jgi:hypothetical protein